MSDKRQIKIGDVVRVSNKALGWGWVLGLEKAEVTTDDEFVVKEIHESIDCGCASRYCAGHDPTADTPWNPARNCPSPDLTRLAFLYNFPLIDGDDRANGFDVGWLELTEEQKELEPVESD